MRRLAASLAIILVSFLLCSAPSPAQNPPGAVPADAPYKNAALPVEKRVADLLGRMTLEEKVTMLSGAGWMESAAIPRLGIPAEGEPTHDRRNEHGQPRDHDEMDRRNSCAAGYVVRRPGGGKCNRVDPVR